MTVQLVTTIGKNIQKTPRRDIISKVTSTFLGLNYDIVHRIATLWNSFVKTILDETDSMRALKRCLKVADFVFMGEAHFIDDESYITNNLEELKKAGVTTLAVEVFSDKKVELIKLATKGDTSGFSKKWAILLLGSSGLMALIRKALKLGIDVVPIDMDSGTYHKLETQFGFTGNRTNALRDVFIARNLKGLAKRGKVLVVAGATHAANSSYPYRTAHFILKRDGFKTASIKMESRSVIQHAKIFKYSPRTVEAYRTLIGKAKLSRVVSIPTSVLGAMRYANMTSSLSSRTVSYSNTFDYVFLLPPHYSRSIIENYRRVARKLGIIK